MKLIKENDKKVIRNSTCEIQICRGKNPGLIKMELYLKNNVDDQ